MEIKITDAMVDSILRDMGVDLDNKNPPYWKTRYRTDKCGYKHEEGYICSRCGKYSYYKKEKCDGCDSVMRNLKINGKMVFEGDIVRLLPRKVHNAPSFLVIGNIYDNPELLKGE